MHADGGSWPENGQTTIGFTPLHQRETDGRTGAVHIPDPASKEEERAPVGVCLAWRTRAVENKAVAVSPPESKEWG